MSKNYIKMCEKAKEIQKLWKPKVGDYVWRKHNFFGEKIDKQIWSKDKREEIIILTYASDVDGYFHATKEGETRIFNSHNEAHKKTCIWLPTQEQLQEILYKHYQCNEDIKYLYCHSYNKYMIKKFCDFVVEATESDFNSLWLAFVMKEKFKKSWSKEKKEWEAVK